MPFVRARLMPSRPRTQGLIATWARSYLRECDLELLEDAQVVLEQRADVRDVELDHRHAIQTHAEGETAPFIGIDADVAQDLRMDHPAAEDLHPARLGAGAASGPFAEHTRHIHFGRRLGEGKVARPHAHLQLLAEEFPDEVLERGPEMADVDAS